MSTLNQPPDAATNKGGGRGGGRGRGRGGGRGGKGSGAEGDNTAPKMICREFATTGKCRFGSNCRNSHGHAEDMKIEAERPLCPDLARYGSCKVGSNCRFSHDTSRSASRGSDALAAVRKAVQTSLVSPALAHQVNAMFHAPNAFGSPKRVTDPSVLDPSGRVNNSEAAKFLAEVMRQLTVTQAEFFAVINEMHPAVRALSKIAQSDNFVTTIVPFGSTKFLSFQRVFVPLLFVLSHGALEETSMKSKANVLLSAVQDHVVPMVIQFIAHTVPLLDKGSLDDGGATSVINQQFVPVSFAQLFGPMAKFLEIIIKRLPNVANLPNVKQGVTTIQQLIDLWASHVASGTLKSIETQFAVDRINEVMNRVRCAMDGGLDTMLARAMERASLNTAAAMAANTNRARNTNLWADDQLEAPTGVHDNDHVAIANIKLIPTHNEVICGQDSPLPGNLQFEPNAHWLPPGPARLLDTHFRLLREDMMSSVKTGIRLFLAHLAEGGQFRESGRFTRNQGNEGTDLAVYTNVLASNIAVLPRYGATVPVTFDLPPRAVGKTRDGSGSLARFWENCLQRDNLVCVCFPDPSGAYSPVFATVANRDDKISYHEAANGGRGTISLSFGVTAIPSGVLKDRSRGRRSKHAPSMFLVECRGLLFEAYRPVLKALAERSESIVDLPFPHVLCPPEPPAATRPAPPPKYALAPGFQLDLSFLKKSGSAGPRLLFSTDQAPGVRDALVANLIEYTTLDATQSQALLGALGSEVACIQGPPGTGKSFIGVKIVEALYKLNNKDLFPIMCLCYTNHALDDFLESLIDVGIGSLVRIGSRPSEKLEPYSLRNQRYQPSRGFFGNIKSLESQLNDATKRLSELLAMDMDRVNSRDVWRYLNKLFRSFTEAVASFQLPGSWLDGWMRGDDININRSIIVESLRAPKGGNIYNLLRDKGPEDDFDLDQLALVAEGVDGVNTDKGKTAISVDEDVAQGFGTGASLKLTPEATLAQARLRSIEARRPDKSLDELLEVSDVWALKLTERHALADYMIGRVRAEYELDVGRARNEFQGIMENLADMRAQLDIEAVRRKKVIGLTTTGAAKYQHLIAAVRPKVIICEEAGEILEAHVLAALHPGVQQLILIGDHKQLRPKTNDFRLDVKSQFGKSYRLNVSLFERLIVSETPRIPPMLPHAVLLAQRRMKPIISQFIKHVYPELEDGDGTAGRPPIKGVAKDVFFLSHDKPQDATKEDWGGHSHSHTYEANMAISLVEYLLKQGYGHRQIVVLTPYVGQLLKIREIMGQRRLVVEVGELDAKDMDLATGGNALDDDLVLATSGKVKIEETSLRKCIRVAAVDNFQGEEADIIILSTVRSSFEDGSARGIGFVKDANRTVVALSRARMGMYIIGNANLLAAEKSGSPDWAHVVSLMRKQDLIGAAIEVYCQRHPDYRHWVNDPDHLRIVSPDGGCNQSCDFRLHCGHTCQRMCHSDDQKHVLYACRKPCARLHEGCGHPCPKLCSTDCGKCMTVVDPITLPCGHVREKPLCCETKSIESIQCRKKVAKTRFCGHTIMVECCSDPDERPCPSVCGGALECGHSCNHNCGSCTQRDKQVPDGKVTKHKPCSQPCGRAQHCKHSCSVRCNDHPKDRCPPCQQPCTATVCDHGRCPRKCSEPCTPCIEPCTWSCPHGAGTCPLPCGAPCIRVPCDLRCDKLLTCGHRCPSVCGEVCPSPEYCIECGSDDLKNQTVDFITLESLGGIDPDEFPIVVLSCGHALTVANCDAMFALESVYRRLGSHWVSVKPFPEDDERIKSVFTCPNCRAPISGQQIRRYGRVLKRSVMTIAGHHFAQAVSKQIVGFAENVGSLQESVSSLSLRVDDSANVTKPAEDHIKAGQQMLKWVKSDPTRRVTDACWHAASDASIRRELEATVFIRNYTVEEGRVLFLMARTALTVLTHFARIGHKRGLPWADKADSFLCQAVAQFALSNAKFRVAEARLEQLAVAKSKLDLLLVHEATDTYSELSLQGKEEHVKQCLRFAEKCVEMVRSCIGEAALDVAIQDHDSRLANYLAYFVEALESIKNGATPRQIEIAQVILAMGASHGHHWYTCPNGHMYFIGDCGQAVQGGTCPDCGARVGGEGYHRLRSDNQLAEGDVVRQAHGVLTRVQSRARAE